jgi:CRP/FNR family transcriptional regulator
VAAPGTEVLLVDAQVVRELFGREPELQVFVLDLFSARLFDLMQLVREVAFDRLDVRLARFLLAESGAAQGIARPIELSHAEIAARLGSAREVVSRTLDRMKHDGLVRMERGRVYVENAIGLRERYGT